MRQAEPCTSFELGMQRSVMLEDISQMSLTPREAQITYPKSDLKHVTEEKKICDLKSSTLPMKQVLLPLPQIETEFGVAKLILKIGLPDLMFLIEMLLLERSVLVIGESIEEVTSVTSAFLSLLKPYEWQSSFLPTLTNEMMDFLSSPVPFIAGMVARNKKHLEKIKMDSRVREAMEIGLSVVDLSSNEVYWTTEKEVRKTLFTHCKSAR